jgi:hypothetical protein
MTAKRCCRHCQVRPASKARGLCYRCYHTPGVIEQYPTTGASARQGIGHRATALPTAPTAARPGSPEKVAVLAERAAASQHLHHPEDCSLFRSSNID